MSLSLVHSSESIAQNELLERLRPYVPPHETPRMCARRLAEEYVEDQLPSRRPAARRLMEMTLEYYDVYERGRISVRAVGRRWHFSKSRAFELITNGKYRLLGFAKQQAERRRGTENA